MRIEGLKIERNWMMGSNHLGMISERLGGTLGFSWFMVSSGHQNLRKNNQLRSNTQRPVVGGERIMNLQSHGLSKRKLPTPLSSSHPLSISSFVTCIISSHMEQPQDGGGGRQSRQSTERAWGRLDPIWNDSIFTCLHHAFFYNM